MATGKASDFKIYEDQMRGGVVETLTQASNYFNAAGGAIRLSTQSRRGQYAQESFFTNIANLVTRRDVTSVSAATDLVLAMAEIISVKCKRKVGPIGQTLDAFKQVQMTAGTDQALSFLIGTQIAKAMEVDMLNNGLRAGVNALKNTADVYYDGSAGTMTASNCRLIAACCSMPPHPHSTNISAPNDGTLTGATSSIAAILPRTAEAFLD